MTAIFTPEREERSFQVSSEGSSIICSPACCAADWAPNNVHTAHARAKVAVIGFISSLSIVIDSVTFRARIPTLPFPRQAAWLQPSQSAGARRRPSSAAVNQIRFLEQVINDEPSNLAAHVLTDARREAIVKSRVDPRHCHLVRIRPDIGPAVSDARRRRTCH